MADPIVPIDLLNLMIDRGLEDVKNLRLPLLRMLSRRHRDCFQRKVKWQARVAAAGTSTNSTNADAALPTSDTNVPAELDCDAFRFEQTITFKNQDVEEAARYGTDPLKNLVGQHLSGAMENILTGINVELFRGVGTEADGGVYGLDMAVGAGGIYAGISRATYNDWQSAVLGNAGTPRDVTRPLMRQTATALENLGGSYDFIMTSPDIRDAYEGVFDTNAGYQVQAQGADVLNTVGSSLFYKSRPVISDKDCQPGVMYFLNSTKLEIHSRRFEGTVKEPSTGLNFLVKALPSNNPHASKVSVSTIVQMALKNRREAALLSDLQ